MAAPLGKSMKRLESRKSHSWWWDSHVSTKNSKWLSDNLEEMDKSVKRMLKLIEEDGDSFAKKAEMYYQKRPELISNVEEFYRLYRSLAERYDHVTGELRKNIPSDLQSQGSGVSDITSELNSTPVSPDHRSSRRRSGHRAAGFDFFLGSGGNGTDNFQKEGDELSSLTDSETESDCSSVNNYINFGNGGGDQGFRRKMLELEIEPRDVKERLRLQQEDSRAENSNDSFSRVNEHELRIANEKIQDSEEEIARLRVELQKLRLLDVKNFLQEELESPTKRELQTPCSEDLETNQVTEFQEAAKSDRKIQALVEELKMTKDRLKDSENEINSLRDELEKNRSSDKIRKLQDQLQLTQKEVATWKAKLNSQKREVSKLQDRISMLKSSLSDRDHEVRDLKTAVSDAEQKIFPEKSQVKAEISKLLEERIRFEEQIKELESQGRYLEDEIRKIKVEKAELEERFNAEIGQLKTQVFERGNKIESLNRGVDALRTERDELNAVVVNLKAEVSNKEDQIDQMHKELQQLGNERVEMIAGAEMTIKLVEDLKLRARELEDEVERQRVSILEGAERKREAIRQLCFSLEHYRDEYVMLRKACRGNKRVPVLKTNLVV